MPAQQRRYGATNASAQAILVCVSPRWGGTVGHAFDRRVDPVTLERLDTPEQIDSWNRIWQFFDWQLRPYEDKSKPPAPVRVQP